MDQAEGFRYPLQSSIRVLVVDDSPQDADLLSATLGQQGLNVECVRVDDVDAMARALEEQSWDAVVSEHDLPQFSSAEALATLKESGRILPFLIVSRAVGEDAAVAAMRAGADDFLVKERLARLGRALIAAMRAAEARRERLHAELALRESERQLRDLSRHLQHVVEEERCAIAREIHDDIGGTLTALRFDLSWMERNGPPALAQRATQALQTLAVAQQASQRIMQNLRPPVLDSGIVAALDWQLGEFRKRTGCTAHLHTNSDQVALSDEVSIAVYRVLQEALTNVVKHSGATRVDVDLVVGGGMLSLEILDDGRGIESSDLEKSTSYGLRGLSERARAVGGWLEVSPGRKGTALLLTVPVLVPGAIREAA